MAKGFRAFHVAYEEGEAFLLPSVERRAYEVAREYPLLEATCTRGGADRVKAIHRSPQPKCTCGYHAYTHASGAAEYMGYGGQTGIMADVWGHGPVMNHEVGFRSRHMQIINFYHPFCTCKLPATLAMRQRDPESWPAKLTFYCGNCAPQRVHKQAGFLDNLIPISVVLEALAAKFKCGVFSIEQSKMVVEGFFNWNAEVDGILRLGQVQRRLEAEKLRQAQQEEADRKQRKRWNREAARQERLV